MAPMTSGIQDVVYTIEEGWGARLIKGSIWLVVLGAVFAYYAWSQFRGLREPVAMEYAQLGRNLAEGRGFTTHCVRPLDLGYLAAERQVPPDLRAFPDIRHAPLYPAILGAGFSVVRPAWTVGRKGEIFAPEAWVVVPVGVLCTLGTAWLLFLLGARVFDRRVGLTAMLLYVLSNSVLAESIVGTPVPLLALLSTGAFLAAYRAAQALNDDESPVRWWSALAVAGVLAGLAFLTSYAAAVLVPALALFLWLQVENRRGTAVAAVAGIALLVAAPWLVRNVAVSGGVLGVTSHAALHESILYEGHSIDRTVTPDLGNVKVARALKAKLLGNLGRAMDVDLRLLGTGLIGCFFLVSFFHRFERPNVAAFRWGGALALALMLVIVALGDADSPRLLAALAPVAIVIGTGYLFAMAQNSEVFEAAWDVVLAWILVALTAVPAVLKVVGPPAEHPYPPYYPPFIAFVSGMLHEDEVLCTDIPWATAWYGRRTSLLAPQTAEEFLKLHEEGTVKAGGLYLTTETGGRPYAGDLADGPSASWLPVLNGQVPEGFPFKDGIALPPGSRDQVFLTDGKRWKQEEKPSAAPAGDVTGSR